MTNAATKSIVFITGTFIGRNCWDEWKKYFESKGYQCTAPAWPGKNASSEILRNRHPDFAIASNRLSGLVDYFAGIITEFPVKPILIGHSLGGLVVELLLQRGLGMAGIAIHPFPSTGVSLFNFSFLKVILAPMGFFTSSHKTYMIPFRKWKNIIANGMDCEKQKQLFYKYAIPESKLIIRDVFRPTAKIDFGRDRPPLLLISGSRDKVVSSPLVFSMYEKYKMGSSITDYRDFKGRNHLAFENPLWKEETDFIHFWLQGLK